VCVCYYHYSVRGRTAVGRALINAKSRYKIIGLYVILCIKRCGVIVGTFSIFDGTCESVFLSENHLLKEKVCILKLQRNINLWEPIKRH
jgi:hypothetical protein